jgi:hypothetical protein
MADSTLANLTAATAATGGLFYGTQSSADKKFTLTAAGATLIEAANVAAQVTALNAVTSGGALGTPSSGALTNCTSIPAGQLTGTVATARLGTGTADATTYLRGDSTFATLPDQIQLACSDETTALTAGTAKVTFRMPYAMTLTAVRASVTTAPTGSTLVVDINEGGTSVLSTKLSIDATEKTSTTAATAAVISDSSLANDAEITIDIDQIGSTVAGAGLKVILIGTRA